MNDYIFIIVLILIVLVILGITNKKNAEKFGGIKIENIKIQYIILVHLLEYLQLLSLKIFIQGGVAIGW